MILSHAQKLLLALLCCIIVALVASASSRFVVVLVLLLFAPGYLLDRTLPAPLPALPFLRPALWIGLSISSIALLYEWTTTFSLPLTTPVLAALLLGCGLLLLRDLWRRAASPDRVLKHRVAWGMLLLVLGPTLWVRFYQIRSLALPVWVDPVHHALMIRVTTESGFFPRSLQPYLPVENLPYHWGYHVLTAAVVQLSHLDIPRAILWEGQILNVLHVITCAALAVFLWKKPLAGIVAGIVVGLVSIMPAYYVSWGRYTHLVGLLLLPPLAICWSTLLHTPTRNGLLQTALLLAGLCISHFLVLLLALCLLATISLAWALDKPWPTIGHRLGYTALGASLSLVLTLPWLRILSSRTTTPSSGYSQQFISGGDYVAFHTGLLWAGQNRLLISLAAVALLLGLWQRSKQSGIYLAWIMLLFVLANPWLITYLFPVAGIVLLLWSIFQRRLRPLLAGTAGAIALMLVNPALVSVPYLWLITNDTILISLFVPLSVMIGGGAHMVATRIRHIPQRPRRIFWTVSGAALLVAWAIWGGWKLRDVVNNKTNLVTAADIQAIEWINEHPEVVPPDARFLINAASWYPDADRGSDGGYWIMPLTGRWTSTPPAVFTHGPVEQVQHVQQISRFVRDFQPIQHIRLEELIEEYAITHIYLGPQPGNLTATTFSDNRKYEKVYDQDGVIIFAVHDPPPSPAPPE